MSCCSRPPIWSLGDVRTFSLPNQWAVCVCLPHAGGLRGAVRQTEGLGLQLLVALHQDGLRHGRSRGGQPHHWSVPCTEVKRPPTSSSFFSPCLLFPILLCLAPLFSPSKDSPLRKTCRLLLPKSDSLQRASSLPRPSVSKQRGVKKQAKQSDDRRRGELDWGVIAAVEWREGIYFGCCFGFSLPASVLVKAWMLNVSVDFACVRARVGPLGRRFVPDNDDDGGVCIGAMMPASPERTRPLACPCSSGWRAPFELFGLQLPPPPSLLQTQIPLQSNLQRTSCTEQLLRMYNGRKKGRYNHGVVCLLHSDTSSELLHYTLSGGRARGRNFFSLWFFNCGFEFHLRPNSQVLSFFKKTMETFHILYMHKICWWVQNVARTLHFCILRTGEGPSKRTWLLLFFFFFSNVHSYSKVAWNSQLNKKKTLSL